MDDIEVIELTEDQTQVILYAAILADKILDAGRETLEALTHEELMDAAESLAVAWGIICPPGEHLTSEVH